MDTLIRTPALSVLASRLADLLGPRRRTSRLVAALSVLAILSLVDLWLTLMFATSVGMLESNPVARAVMAMGCPNLLALWKIACVGLACGFLFYARRSRWAEPAAWLCVLLLVWLTVRWSAYVGEMHQLTGMLGHSEIVGDPKWVVMGNTGALP
jgi:hypothetical protein